MTVYVEGNQWWVRRHDGPTTWHEKLSSPPSGGDEPLLLQRVGLAWFELTGEGLISAPANWDDLYWVVPEKGYHWKHYTENKEPSGALRGRQGHLRTGYHNLHREVVKDETE